jgi:hypothetical protein
MKKFALVEQYTNVVEKYFNNLEEALKAKKEILLEDEFATSEDYQVYQLVETEPIFKQTLVTIKRKEI